jgi:lysophospholipid acyltransferase (LPLAT)-like uncharacterized protein
VLARRALGLVLGLVARLWLATLRLTLVLDPALRLDDPRPFVYAFWHGQQFALMRWRMRGRTAALVSRSRDGELVATALARIGVASERGSSSRGGAAGLRAIVRRLRGGLDAAFALDGPRGPARVVRSDGRGVGAALAARLGGGVVVPFASACARCRVFARAWDRFELPLPFTRVAVVVGAPMAADDATPEALGAALGRARGEAEQALTPPAPLSRRPVGRGGSQKGELL